MFYFPDFNIILIVCELNTAQEHLKYIAHRTVTRSIIIIQKINKFIKLNCEFMDVRYHSRIAANFQIILWLQFAKAQH